MPLTYGRKVSLQKTGLNLFTPTDILNAQCRFERIRGDLLINTIIKECKVVLTRVGDDKPNASEVVHFKNQKTDFSSIQTFEPNSKQPKKELVLETVLTDKPQPCVVLDKLPIDEFNSLNSTEISVDYCCQDIACSSSTKSGVSKITNCSVSSQERLITSESKLDLLQETVANDILQINCQRSFSNESLQKQGVDLDGVFESTTKKVEIGANEISDCSNNVVANVFCCQRNNIRNETLNERQQRAVIVNEETVINDNEDCENKAIKKSDVLLLTNHRYDGVISIPSVLENETDDDNNLLDESEGVFEVVGFSDDKPSTTCVICKTDSNNNNVVEKNEFCKNLFLCNDCRIPYEQWHIQPWKYVTLHCCNCVKNCLNSSCFQCRNITENWMSLEPWKFTTSICPHATDSFSQSKFTLSECTVCHFWSCVNRVLNETYGKNSALYDPQVVDKPSDCKNFDLIAANFMPWIETVPPLSATKSDVPADSISSVNNTTASSPISPIDLVDKQKKFNLIKRSQFLKNQPTKFLFDHIDSSDENQQESGPRIRYVSRRASVVSGSVISESSGALSALPNNVKRLIMKLDQRKLENLYTTLREKLPPLYSDEDERLPSNNSNVGNAKRKRLNGLKEPAIVKKRKLDIIHRTSRCGVCKACKAENCSVCTTCRDMTSSDGQRSKKQACKKRRCGRILESRRTAKFKG